jgi:plastocyanin
MKTRTLSAAGWLCLGALSASAWAGQMLTEDNVTIDNFSFGPGQIIVARDTKVTWTNQDDIPHTVTDAADKRDFKSPPLDTGEHFDHVFSQPGVYHYFCSIHPKMRGTIIVK